MFFVANNLFGLVPNTMFKFPLSSWSLGNQGLCGPQTTIPCCLNSILHALALALLPNLVGQAPIPNLQLLATQIPQFSHNVTKKKKKFSSPKVAVAIVCGATLFLILIIIFIAFLLC